MSLKKNRFLDCTAFLPSHVIDSAATGGVNCVKLPPHSLALHMGLERRVKEVLHPRRGAAEKVLFTAVHGVLYWERGAPNKAAANLCSL
jgi:hypothetical protein